MCSSPHKMCFKKIILRACSHGSGEPQAGEVPLSGGVTDLSIQCLFFLTVFTCYVGYPTKAGYLVSRSR